VPTTDIEEAGAWLRLTLITGLGNITLRKLLTEFGTPEKILAARPVELRNFVTAEVAALIAGGGENHKAPPGPARGGPPRCSSSRTVRPWGLRPVAA